MSSGASAISLGLAVTQAEEAYKAAVDAYDVELANLRTAQNATNVSAEAKEAAIKLVKADLDAARTKRDAAAKALAKPKFKSAMHGDNYYSGFDAVSYDAKRDALSKSEYELDKAAAETKKKCHSKQSHMNELRAVLMEQLKQMEDEAGKGKPGKGCGFSCSEDRALEEMIETYKDLNDKTCGMITDYHTDRKVNLLEAKRVALESCTFGFLHKDMCEGVSDCNPYPDAVPETLVGCSGLREGQPFFFDRDLKAVGRYLAGSQANGDSPAANGHAASLYPTNTLAPGRGKSLWVNVCYECGEGKGVDGICVKWVPANEMEYAKFAMLNKIRKRIRDQKRHILSVNRQIVDLQLKLKGVGHRGGVLNNEMDTVDRADALQKFLKRSMRRAKRRLYRDEEAREQRRLTEDLRTYAMNDPEAANYINGVGRKLKRKSSRKSKKSKGKKSKKR